MEELVCQQCGLIQTYEEALLTFQDIANGNNHIRATCCGCNKWIKWLKKTPEVMKIMMSKNEFQIPEDSNPIKDVVIETEDDGKCPF